MIVYLFLGKHIGNGIETQVSVTRKTFNLIGHYKDFVVYPFLGKHMGENIKDAGKCTT